MPEIDCLLAGVSFRIAAGKPILDALPCFGTSFHSMHPDVCIVFTGISRKNLELDSPMEHSGLLSSFLMPPFIGSCVQTIPLMLSPAQSHSLADILSRGTEAFSVPLLTVPAVLDHIRKCLDHASEVLLILHALTVEIRDFREHRIDVFYIDEIESILYSEFAFEAYRRMFSMFLPDFGSLIVHSSAVRRRDKVMLFLAADEGGKSTAAGLSSEGKILSDDRNVLKRNGDGFSVHPTPWGKICNLEVSAPLGGLFLLEKADTFSLEPLDPRVLVYFLWEDNRPFWDHLPVARRTKVLDLLIAASRSVPVYRMRFPKEYIDWTALDKAVAD